MVAYDPSLAPILWAAGKETAFLGPTLAFVAALLFGAVLIAVFRRWQREDDSLSPAASDEMAHYRALYERGEISEEEYKRLRNVLGGHLRRSLNLPSTQPKEISKENATPPAAQNRPDDPKNPPAEEVHPA